MLTIGFVGPYPPIRGGIAQHSRQVVEALRARGHRVVVHSWRAQYPRLLYRGEQAAVDRDTAPAPDEHWSLRWWAPWTWVTVGRQLRHADAVVLPWVHPFHALALWVLLAIAGRPTVAIVHNLVPHERLPGDLRLARWVLRRARGVVVHATAVADDVAAALPATPRRQIAHPPNLSLTATPLPDGTPRVLFLGYVRHYKGVDLLLEALARPELVDVHATIAGECWEPTGQELADLVARLGLEERVLLEDGYVPDERMRELLTSHHVLVTPYRTATQSGLVPLAHAAGRPVVATRVGGLRDQVEAGVDGVLVRSEDPAALAAGLREAVDAGARLADGAAAAAPRWDEVASAIEELVGHAPLADTGGHR